MNAGFPAVLPEPPAPAWCVLPAAHQPHWRQHPAYTRSVQTLSAAVPLVTSLEVAAVRRSLARVAAGDVRILQSGDCAESFAEATEGHTCAKLAVVDLLADRLELRTGQPAVRMGRIGGQFAKPRSQPTEWIGDLELPAFCGHLINSEAPAAAARQPDPRRMLWAYHASSRVLGWVDAHRAERAAAVEPGGQATGPWSSHEALVVDYEAALIRTDDATGEPYLASTHFPWIGERTRQAGSAHVQMLATVANAVGCKLGPTAGVAEVLELCALLDPDRLPGRLVLISRMGSRRVREVLPDLVDAVHRAGHPAVWLCDPMHGNTVTRDGVKTRYLTDLIDEVRAFEQILQQRGRHPGGLHLEVAADDVTECVGGAVDCPELLGFRYTTLCDPRLNPEQALELIDAIG